jgi:hypothetical protein
MSADPISFGAGHGAGAGAVSDAKSERPGRVGGRGNTVPGPGARPRCRAEFNHVAKMFYVMKPLPNDSQWRGPLVASSSLEELGPGHNEFRHPDSAAARSRCSCAVGGEPVRQLANNHRDHTEDCSGAGRITGLNGAFARLSRTDSAADHSPKRFGWHRDGCAGWATIFPG